MITTSNFIGIDRNIFNYFRGNYDCMIQLIDYIQAYNMYYSSNKLTSDGAFFVTNRKTTERLGFSRPKVIKHKKMLEEMGFIKTELINNITYIRINIDKINQIQNASYNIPTNNDYIEESIQEREDIYGEYDLQDNPEESNLKLIPIPEKKTDVVKCDNVLNRWNEIAKKHNLSCIKMLTDARKRKYKTLISSLKISEDEFFNCIDIALSQSSFLRGEKKDWKADFDFFTNKGKVVKAFEGSYKDNDFVSDSLRLSCREQEMLRKRQTLDNLFKDEEEEKLKLN